MAEDAHRRMRELLGAYALGDLAGDEATAVEAHLDGCAACRGELAEIASLVGDLGLVDTSRLGDLPSPDPALGERIRASVAAERQLVQAREAAGRRRDAVTGRRRWLVAGAAGLALLLAGTALGTALDSTPAVPAAAPVVPMEPLELARASDTSPQVETAALIAHTWGVEVRMAGTGFTEGEVFRAAFRTRDGRLLPAGEFLGTGEKRLDCNLQAALLREDSVGFVVLDDEGTEVLSTVLA